jgi:cellulose synthase/poly-beta-1,6-N-acetylglucosamine synthase-like glycosyltransferase
VELILFAILLLPFAYYINLFANAWKFLNTKEIKKSILPTGTKVTVIVPFKDATEQLLVWLASFENLPLADQVEVLLINDGSVNSLMKLRKKLASDGKKNIKLVDRIHRGKKSSIEYGVSIARGEIIICTDADTRPGRCWIEGILETFSDENIQMVCGRVAPANGQWFAAIDFMALMAAGEVLIKKQKPVMCSGSHMAFRRGAFMDVNGYKGYHHFASGDDVILLYKIKEKFGPESIGFNDYRESYVVTDMPISLGQLLSQRQRWGGKAIYYRDVFSLLLSVLVLYCSLMTYGIFFIAIPSVPLVLMALVIVLTKAWVDVRIIYKYAREVHHPVKPWQVAAATLLYPIFMAIVFLRILVNPNPRWG